MSAETTTEWELRLKEYVSAPFKKLIDYATGADKKLHQVAGGLTKAEKASMSMGREFKRSYAGLESTLVNLEKRQKQAFDTKHILAYERIIKRVKSEMDARAAITQPPAEALSKWALFKNKISEASGEIPGLSRGISLIGNPMVLAGAAALALGVGLKKSVDLAVQYETGMAKINATAQMSAGNLGLLKNRLIEIGSHSGGNFELIPDAYEKILSQTGKVNLSLDILETAVKGAKAGFTDIDTLSSAVAQSLSSIGTKNATAAEVLDTFMMAKKVGAGEFKDFAQYLPQLISSGKNLAISYKDTAGLFAYMTGKGQSAADSAMLMNNAFTALQKNEVLKGLKKKGIMLFDKDGMRRNINDVFQDLSKKLSGLSDRKKSQFFIDIGLNDAQAKTAFSVLTSEADKLNDTMKDVNNALGETDRQLEMTGNRARTWGDIGDQIKSWGVAIGDKVLPMIDALVNGIQMAVDGWHQLFSNDEQKEVMMKGILETKANAYALEFGKDQAEKKYGKGWKENMVGKKGYHEAWMFERNQTESFYKKAINVNNKNNIDKKESVAESAFNNVNKGKSALDNSGSSSDSEDTKIKGSGVKTLIMNLYITNSVKADSDSNLHKLKQKITDIIVDAARDGMTTIGV